MNGFPMPDFAPAAPEMFLLAAACLVLVFDVYAPASGERIHTYRLSQITLALTALLVLVGFPGETFVTFSGTFVLDPMAAVLKLFVLVVTWFGFFYARDYLRERGQLSGEYFILGLFAVLGMFVLISAFSLLTIYLGLELLSLSLYAMVALDRDSGAASEAAIKYFVLGALASGMLLYGISMTYGATGSLQILEVREATAALGATDIVLTLGLVFVLVGIGFKLGAAPFHMWIPDVYEGSRTPVTLFVGTAPKLAAFGMLIRLLVDSFESLHASWEQMLILLAVVSIALGNLVAIAQTNIKRMLAYSTIGHMGYLFLGVLTGTAAGYAASMFYVLVYTVMTLAAFGIIIVASRQGFESDRITDFRGLNERSPWTAFLMLIVMLAMGGIPPLVGFWAKWSVLREVVAAGHLWLAVVAVVFSVVGLFYYLRVVKHMYFDPPEELPPLQYQGDTQVVLSLNGLAILALGLFPGALLTLCLRALGG